MKKKSLKLNLILNIIKTICSMCFPLITFPYISRVIQATNYGKINFSNSIVSYFTLIAALGISTYAIREGAGLREKKEKFNEFACQIFSINILTTIISYILMVILYICWPKLHNYTLLLLVQSIIIIVNTIGVEWLYSIYEDYLYITVRSILVQILSLISLFLFVKTPNDYIIYAGITVFANAGANIFNYIHAKKYCKFKLVKNLNLQKHIKPMLILFFSNLTITLYTNSDMTILGTIKDDYTVGIYSIAVKINIIIKQLISAIMVVVLPRLSYNIQNDKEQYEMLLEKLKKTMIYFILPITVGVSMLSEKIILVLAGTEFLQAQYALIILSLAIIPSTYATIYGNGVLLLNKCEKKILKSTLIGASVNIVLNLILIPFWAEKAAAITTVLAELVVCIINMRYAKKYMKKTKGVLGVVLKSIAGCVLIVGICLLTIMYISNAILAIFVSVVLSIIIYSVIIGLTEPLVRELVKNNIAKVMKKNEQN